MGITLRASYKNINEVETILKHIDESIFVDTPQVFNIIIDLKKSINSLFDKEPFIPKEDFENYNYTWPPKKKSNP
ncbi:MAG: hypothetical protein HYY52_08660 [Candidatus Melainabacteria bacterium]|nr:hypothetical protein [Candidatus Melainabacteria bacterium]